MQTVLESLPPRLPPAAPVEGPAFDLWLREQLGRMHDHVLAEPIPEQMLRLLDQLRDR